MSSEENLRGDQIRQTSEDRDDREGDHDRHQLVISLKVCVGARTLGAGRLHGRQERPPLPHLDGDLIIEEYCDENCDFKDKNEAEQDDLAEDAFARAAQGSDEPHCDTALDDPCLGQPDLGLEREHDSDVTLPSHDENRKKGRY